MKERQTQYEGSPAALKLELLDRGQGSIHFDKLTVVFGINHLQCAVFEAEITKHTMANKG